jgi:type II secretory ATPase GspE/PulE/Tfp pilus assembly ATPase PilB-like protein
MEKPLRPRKHLHRAGSLLFVALLVLAAAGGLAQEAANAGADAAETAGPAPSIVLYMNPIWIAVFAVSAIIWLYIVSWASEDAVGVGMNFHHWNTFLILAGLPGLALGLFVHGALSLLTPGLVAMVFTGYIGKRNMSVPDRYKFFGAHHRARILSKVPLLNALASEPDDTPAGEIALPVNNSDGVSLSEHAARYPDMAKAYHALSEATLRAASAECSAVHLVSKGEGYVLQYVIDGVLHNIKEIPAVEAQQIMASASRFAGLADEGRMRPGRVTITGELPGHGEVEIGLQIKARGGKPTLSLVMPNWHRQLHLEGLEALGMHEALVRRIEAVLAQHSGTLVVCSPPGNGKTTSLFGVAAQIDFFTTDIIIIEDGEELPIQHVRRFNIPEDKSFTQFFEEILREDPDDIVMADLKTPEQAELCLNFGAHEGLIVTALTAGSAPEAVLRLSRMAGSSLVSQSVTCVIAQKLVRTLCTDCREAVEPNPSLLAKLKLDPENPGQWFRPVGCENCLGTGYRGRTGIFAMLILTDAVKKVLTSEKPSEGAIREAAGKTALRTLYQDGLSKVVAGITTLDEIRRVQK